MSVCTIKMDSSETGLHIQVAFQSVLDLSPHFEGGAVYDLTAVCEHRGAVLDSGHYVSYVTLGATAHTLT